MQLPNLIKALKRPGTDLAETHISWVIISAKYTLKIKKPVKFSFLDFTTLAKRKHFCQQEIKLNQRFSPSIYLKVIPLKENNRIIDYAVVMKTLPPEKRLDKLLKNHKVTPLMIKKLAKKVWAFHKKAKIIKNFKQPDQMRQNYARDFRTISKFQGKAISPKLFTQIHSYIAQFIKNNKELLQSRIREGKIRDLHGDLHSENIFYYKKPYLFDCIEFNSAFRQIDLAAEISFLLMDLESKGEKILAETFLAAYLKASGEKGIDRLINFYKCHYAFVDGLVATLSKKYKLARRYFKLAGKYAAVKPKLIAISGIIGTGKSTLAKKLADKTGFPLLRSDAVRKELAAKKRIANLYSAASIRKTYKVMLAKAKKLLQSNHGVILDATFSKKTYRRWLMELTKQTNADFKFIEMKISRKLALKRLAARKNDISDAGPSLLNKFIKSYEPPTEIPRNQYYSPSNSV